MPTLVTNEKLWSSDARIVPPLDPTSGADQTAALQAMATLLTQSPDRRDRVGYLTPGFYRKNASWTFDNSNGHHPFTLEGAGSKIGGDAATVVCDTQDLGAGAYSLGLTSGNAAYNMSGIAFITGAGNAGPGGTYWQMSGVMAGGYNTIHDVHAQGYFQGIVPVGDHMLIQDFDVRGNTYGIGFPSSVTQGDVIFKRGRAGACSRAAIGVARSGAMAGVRMEDVEGSQSPFVIHRYDDGTGRSVPNWINGVEIINIATENSQNGIVHDGVGDGAGIVGVIFDHGNASNWGLYDPNGGWQGQPQVAAWYNTGPVAVHFPQSLPTFTRTQPAILAPAMEVTCPTAKGLPGACSAGYLPFRLLGNQNGSHLVGTALGDNRGYRTSVAPYKVAAFGSISQGRLVSPYDLYDVMPYGNWPGSRILGVATHDAAVGTVIHVAESGVEIPLFNSSAVTIGRGVPLIPHPGGGVQAGSHTQGPVIGHYVYDTAPGALGPATVKV